MVEEICPDEGIMDTVSPDDALGSFDITVPDDTTPEDVVDGPEVEFTDGDSIVITPTEGPERVIVLRIRVRGVSVVTVEFTDKRPGRPSRTTEEDVCIALFF